MAREDVIFKEFQELNNPVALQAWLHGQAKSFNDTVYLYGIILTMIDVYEKGGAFISAAYVTKKPILLVGNGQSLKDIKEFNKEEILKGIF